MHSTETKSYNALKASTLAGKVAGLIPALMQSDSAKEAVSLPGSPRRCSTGNLRMVFDADITALSYDLRARTLPEACRARGLKTVEDGWMW